MTVPRSGTGPLGGLRFLPVMILFAFVLQVVTGVALWTFYSPNSLSAWESLFHLQFTLPGGWMIRGLHHFSAQILVALLGFYLLGQVLTGKYRVPREFVFWTAFLLFLFSLGALLTGELLSWTLSGFSATLVRARFLNMLPGVGEALFRIVAGGPEFGTLTITRFLVLHILVFGGGFFVLTLLWCRSDHRSESTTGENSGERTPFWSDEALRCSLACLLIMAVLLVLVYRKPLLHALRPDWFPVPVHLPTESLLGVDLDAPADLGNFYGAARPWWPFRALDQLGRLKTSDGDSVFSGEKQYIPVFIIPAALIFYALLIPLIGRAKIGHGINIAAVSLLLFGGGYLTVASYRSDREFQEERARSERVAERAVELCLNPEGIPSTGALTLIQRDPFLQGPVLFQRHCAACHAFSPFSGEREHPDFPPIACETVRAPNLYRPIRRERIEGFLSVRRIQSDDYFGRTKFAGGRMVNYLRDRMRDILRDNEKNEEQLDELISLLYEEARRDAPRQVTPMEVEGLSHDRLVPLQTFECGRCHLTYLSSSKPAVPAPDLRGYMSRDWMVGMIADPEASRFYGPSIGANQGNDAMPAFHRSSEEAIMDLEEIEILADWLRGQWFRFERSAPLLPLRPDVPSDQGEITEPIPP